MILYVNIFCMSKEKGPLVALLTPVQKWHPMKSAMISVSVRSIASYA